MSSDIINEGEGTAEEKQAEEKKKVTVKVPVKRRISVKKKTEAPAAPEAEAIAPVPEAETLSEAPVEIKSEENLSEKKPRRARKDHQKDHAARKGRRKESSPEGEAELPLFEEAAAETPAPASEAEPVKPEEEKKSEETPAPVEEEKAESTEEVKAEGEISAEEASSDEEEKTEGQDGGERPQFQRRDRFSKKDKFKNKKERRVQEDIPPEVNLDEHPDAPQLFVSVLTALPLEAIREKAKEAGMTEDAILDCRKQELIIRILRHHSSLGGALMVEGVLETMNEGGYGYIRYAVNNYLPGSDDVYVSASIIKSIG